MRLALIGSVQAEGKSSGRLLLLLGTGMLLELIELDTKLERDLIGDSDAGCLTSGSVSIGSGALGRTIAIVAFSLSARFLTMLWIFSSSCLVNVCVSVTCSIMVLLLDPLEPSVATLRKPIGILVLLRDEVACIKLVPAPLELLPVRLRDL